MLKISEIFPLSVSSLEKKCHGKKPINRWIKSKIKLQATVYFQALGVAKKMARKINKANNSLNIFKGRGAKLNRAILKKLTKSQPLTIWEIKKEIDQIRGLKKTRYHTVNTRVRSLETGGYLRKIGEKETKAGSKANLYEATPKAVVTLTMDSLCLDDLIEELDELTALTIASLIAAR